MKKIIFGLAWVLVLSGCISIASPGKSKMYFVQGGEFEINAQQPDKLNYFVVLNVKNPSRSTQYIKTEFENPCNHLAPIVQVDTLALKEQKLLLRSPALECLQPDRYYKVVVKTYSDTAMSNQVDQLVHNVYSIADSKKLMTNSGKEEIYYAP